MITNIDKTFEKQMFQKKKKEKRKKKFQCVTNLDVNEEVKK